MDDTSAIYRILDANANRAREGLRTVEEYLRLGQNDAAFTARLKKLRHEISSLVMKLNIDEQLIDARASDSDVGATNPTGGEAVRLSMEHIVIANLRRSQEALRVLEEYAKLLSTEVAAGFKQLRFEAYTLEKEIRLREQKR